jgi:DnaJ like chaperone protein
VSFIKTALFYMVGSAIGGPIGGLLAAIVGSHMTANRSSGRRAFSSNEQQQTAFFAALFACLAKLAKADGHISEEEIEKIDFYMRERFKFSTEQREFAIKVFNHAKNDAVAYEDYAKQLAALLGSNKNSLVMFYELLFELAMADGILDSNEEKLLRKTTGIFGIDSGLFDGFKKQFADNNPNPYVVLGVDKSMSFSEIKKIYQRKRREFHPDSLVAKGLPDELLQKAQDKFIAIQEAYKLIEQNQATNNG